MSSQASLDTRIRSGDEAAYGAVFHDLYGPLCSYANSIMAAPDIAEELVQDVFVRLWQNRSALDVQTSLKAYLYRAVRNACLNHLERRRTEQNWYQQAVAEAAERTAMHQPGGIERLEAAEVAEQLDAAIARLPPRCRQVIELRWRHGLRHAEIADALGISIKGVENQLSRGLAALRNDLGSRIR